MVPLRGRRPDEALGMSGAVMNFFSREGGGGLPAMERGLPRRLLAVSASLILDCAAIEIVVQKISQRGLDRASGAPLAKGTPVIC